MMSLSFFAHLPLLVLTTRWSTYRVLREWCCPLVIIEISSPKISFFASFCGEGSKQKGLPLVLSVGPCQVNWVKVDASRRKMSGPGPGGSSGEFRIPPLLQTSILKHEAVVCDAKNDFDPSEARPFIGEGIEDFLDEKFILTTSVCKNSARYPNRFYHHSEQSRPPRLHLYWPVLYIERPLRVVSPNVTSKWMSISSLAQDKLYLVLTSGITIWRKLRYVHRANDGVKRDHSCRWVYQEGSPTQAHTILLKYGEKMPSNSNKDVLTVLRRGRTSDEMRNTLKTLMEMNVGEDTMADLWERALTSGMSEGPGRLAVHGLLDAISGLRYGVTSVDGHVRILSDCSSPSDESLLIKNTSEKRSLHSSDSESDEPPGKRTKRTRHIRDSSSESESGSSDYVHPGEQRKKIDSKRSANNRSLVDMKVVSYSYADKTAKYLILVKIHPKGESVEEAKQKFMKELIHVLQAQNEVFGLFFSSSYVYLYKAKRTDKDKGKEITVSFQEYPLFETHTDVAFYFSVCKFQTLVMDILSCILDGLANIHFLT